MQDAHNLAMRFLATVLLALLPGSLGSLRAPAPAPQKLLTFGLISDWGGTDVYPYTTPGQLTAADALEAVAQDMGFEFVVSAGGNFLPAGLEHNTNITERFHATWSDVYGGAALGDIGWCE